MPEFADEREAKEFVIRLIVSEAEKEGVPLSEIERKMLYFSENGWTIPGMVEVAQRFESEYRFGSIREKDGRADKETAKAAKVR